jgi:hypothetical protein
LVCVQLRPSDTQHHNNDVQHWAYKIGNSGRIASGSATKGEGNKEGDGLELALLGKETKLRRKPAWGEGNGA